MATIINICDRTLPNKNQRFQIHNVDINENVLTIKEKIIKLIEPNTKDVELIYCGKQMKDDNKLDIYGIKNGSTIYVLDKHVPEASGIVNNLTEQQVMVALKAAIRKPAYSNIVQKIITDESKINKLISDNPTLISDPAVLSMLVDRGLLVSLIQPGNISKLLSRHPVFGPTALAVATMVNEEAGKDGGSASATAGTYSIDQMSDEEDEVGMGAQGGRPITTSQLAAALMQAQGGYTTNQPSTSSSGESSAASISEQFFQQALMSATQYSVPDSQLQQLRDMGITDDNLARQALMQTGGDLNAAIEILFEDRS
ncbi:hypothetical protein SNE40_011398 [Patella caerulea]|uniref:Ubiquitin-like protein 7 n=1 Tax=Patella caerulea TaxID=87958 RepID=A0AAN8PLL1_PATCE